MEGNTYHMEGATRVTPICKPPPGAQAERIYSTLQFVDILRWEYFVLFTNC